jgi:hypothetical protein
LNWSASTSDPWIQVDISSGGDGARINVAVDPTGLAPGDYSGTVTISDPSATNSPFDVDVFLRVLMSDAPPFGAFNTPIQGSTVRGAIPFTGWALDDVQVSSVKIYREENATLSYLADAKFVPGARPDVEAAYPNYPNNDRAGWGYNMLTNCFPNGGNGTYTLHAIATDSSGQQATLGIKTIHVDNANAVKPFGTIDTPVQGGIASGDSFVVWGWVLTPPPNSIPTDGSTINVFVDGVNLGNPDAYNIYRADIANLFPGYANSNGAGVSFTLDTTLYDNGVHTIQWTVTDSGGNTDGIGSRYFTIENPSTASTDVHPEPIYTECIYKDRSIGGCTEPARLPTLPQPWILLAAIVAVGAIAAMALKRRPA